MAVEVTNTPASSKPTFPPSCPVIFTLFEYGDKFKSPEVVTPILLTLLLVESYKLITS